MITLGFVWLLLLILELTHRLSPFLEQLGTVIWIVFIAEFILKWIYAPSKRRYLKRNWVSGLSLFLPALRVFRIFRALRVLRLASTMRSLRLVRLITSFNRGMKALSRTMGRHGIGYVGLLTALVTVAGAAGMYAFENQVPQGEGLANFGTALWWTSMVMTTMGTDYSPKTAEGRILCLLLAIYAFSVFGYVTATLASFLVGRDASDPESETASSGDIKVLREELISLHQQMKLMEGQLKIFMNQTRENQAIDTKDPG
ncbi:MAG TPA: ion transporter [Oligoflexus sp.]|uniref:ion transporter n=1 Tax=Oligoflexus sp. TaxID=1971216 RepID=UPI002D695E27|nr:ion transporter [Oligoflexus sp.]HYX37102.1 ion transporter [Oligoflexus sp.]